MMNPFVYSRIKTTGVTSTRTKDTTKIAMALPSGGLEKFGSTSGGGIAAGEFRMCVNSSDVGGVDCDMIETEKFFSRFGWSVGSGLVERPSVAFDRR
jgi:hypothetical protein